MKKSVPAFLFAVLLAVLGFQGRSANAYSTYSPGCASCHGAFNSGTYISLADGQSWGNDLMAVHSSTMLSGDCDVCHSAGGRSPVVLDSSIGGSGLDPIACVGCHGRLGDGGNDSISGGLGAGLRRHHYTAGVTICANCHSDANPASYTPVGEDILPPYYANPGTNHPNMPTNPCNQDGNENFAGGPEGLDNDGDGVYDGLDSDCTAAAAPRIEVAPPSNDYGDVTVGDSAGQEFTISNATGTADLVVSGMTLGDTTNYSLNGNGGVNPCGSATPTIAAGENCTVDVTFGPQSAGVHDSNLSIASNDTGNSPLVVPLAGTGVAPPSLTPDISVTDSVAPATDLQVPFGSVTVGASSEQTVTVTNAGTADLVIHSVASAEALAAPFSIASDTCSNQTLAQGENCTVIVEFAPNTTAQANDAFDIPSNDPDENPVTVSVSGTGVANNAPSAPELVLPMDGATGLPTSVTFEWNLSTDPDGDPVAYGLFVCADDNTFAACPDPVNAAPITASAGRNTGLGFAASGLGMMFFGVAFAAGIGRKRTVALLLAIALTAGVLLIACSGGDEAIPPRGQVSFTASGLAPGTTYFWKVTADDGTDSTDSVTRSFSTR